MSRLTTRNSQGIAVFSHGYECETCGDILYRLPDLGDGSPTDKLCEYEEFDTQFELETRKLIIKQRIAVMLHNTAATAIFAVLAIVFKKWWIVLISLLWHSYLSKDK